MSSDPKPPAGEPPLSRVECKGCGKRVTVRPDQFGRRLRCPKCQTAFVVEPPRARASAAQPEPEDEPDGGAVEAGELAMPSAPRPNAAGVSNREFASARFAHPPGVVFEATAFAVRRAGGEVTAMDRTNLNVRFSVGGGALYAEHTAYVFPGPTGGSELDIRPTDSGNALAARLLYGRIGSEILSYLEEHDTHRRATQPPPALPPSREYEPPIRRRRRRREAGVDGFAVCGFIASLVGLVLFCFPLGALPAAFIGSGLCAFSLIQPKGNRGLAIAGLAVGVVALVVSGVWFLFIVQAEMHRQNRLRAELHRPVRCSEDSAGIPPVRTC